MFWLINRIKGRLFHQLKTFFSRLPKQIPVICHFKTVFRIKNQPRTIYLRKHVGLNSESFTKTKPKIKTIIVIDFKKSILMMEKKVEQRLITIKVINIVFNINH